MPDEHSELVGDVLQLGAKPVRDRRTSNNLTIHEKPSPRHPPGNGSPTNATRASAPSAATGRGRSLTSVTIRTPNRWPADIPVRRLVVDEHMYICRAISACDASDASAVPARALLRRKCAAFSAPMDL